MFTMIEACLTYLAVMLTPFPMVYTDVMFTVHLLSSVSSAIHTSQLSYGFTVFTKLHIIKALIALTAEMLLIVRIFYAHIVGTFALAFTTVRT